MDKKFVVFSGTVLGGVTVLYGINKLTKGKMSGFLITATLIATVLGAYILAEKSDGPAYSGAVQAPGPVAEPSKM